MGKFRQEISKSAGKPGKKPEAKVDLPEGWWPRLFMHCRHKFAIDTVDGVCEKTGVSRRAVSNAKASGQMTERTFLTLVTVTGCATPDELMSIIGPPTAVRASAVPEKRIEEPLDEALLVDYLTGMGFAECMGSETNWQQVQVWGQQWLKSHPEDLYFRAMLLWSTVKRGNPGEMVAVLNETESWLVSGCPASHNPKKGERSEAFYRSIEAKVAQLNADRGKFAGFARWHLEDTLVKAAMLRSMRYENRTSRLRKAFGDLAHDLSSHTVMRTLLESTKAQQGDGWVAAAVGRVNQWANLELENGTARFALLWFTGRLGQPDRMQFALDQTCSWLQRNPGHAFVRWAATWLAGICPYGEPMNRVIEETAAWLDVAALDDERVVRMGFLWLVGAMGEASQAQGAIAQTAKWLKAHPQDDYIRIAYLLFLIRRRGTAEQRKEATADTRRWLRHQPDVFGLTRIAVLLCESKPAPGRAALA